jgi:hypothetical protein
LSKPLGREIHADALHHLPRFERANLKAKTSGGLVQIDAKQGQIAWL